MKDKGGKYGEKSFTQLSYQQNQCKHSYFQAKSYKIIPVGFHMLSSAKKVTATRRSLIRLTIGQMAIKPAKKVLCQNWTLQTL